MDNESATPPRFDKLTNLDISNHYQGGTRYLMKCDLLGAFAYWAVSQSPYCSPDIAPALKAFDTYLSTTFPNPDRPMKFTYDQLDKLITEDIFESIPEIEKLNHSANGRDGDRYCSRYQSPSPDDDFIDLSALARNVFYMIMRESITQA